MWLPDYQTIIHHVLWDLSLFFLFTCSFITPPSCQHLYFTLWTWWYVVITGNHHQSTRELYSCLLPLCEASFRPHSDPRCDENTIYTKFIKSWIFTDRTMTLSHWVQPQRPHNPVLKNTAMPDVVWNKPDACSNAPYRTFSFNTTALLLFVPPALFQTCEKDGFVFLRNLLDWFCVSACTTAHYFKWRY